MADVDDTFYKSIPGPLYWPVFVLAILAAIIASQAMISGTFSIIQQSLSLGCFPRVKVVHTSAKYQGQVYIPEMNYILMIACIAITAIFRDTIKIGNAYGIAVVLVMTLTSVFIVLGFLELLYLSSVMYKFNEGGYLPLAFAAFLVTIMLVWNHVYRNKYMFEFNNRVPSDRLKEIITDPNIERIPGLALFYSELVQGVPPIFTHYVANVPALHTVLVFVSIKCLPVSKVPRNERFIFRQVGPRDLFVFRCIARYGYKDVRNEIEESFETMLVQELKEHILQESLKQSTEMMNNGGGGGLEEELRGREVQVIDRECGNGVAHLLGESEVMAKSGSALWKRMMIDYAYNCIKRNLRQQEEVFTIPRARLLKVGMTIEL